jgi:hypothetical protein
MAMSQSKEADLKSKDFDKLLQSKKYNGKLISSGERAYTFARDNITAGSEPRPDDVSEVLLPVLDHDPDLRKHQSENDAKDEKYRRLFVDYIVDKLIFDCKRKK